MSDTHETQGLTLHEMTEAKKLMLTDQSEIFPREIQQQQKS